MASHGFSPCSACQFLQGEDILTNPNGLESVEAALRAHLPGLPLPGFLVAIPPC